MELFTDKTEYYKNLSMEYLDNEEWRDVVGFEEAYQVSNLGRIRSKDRIVKSARYKNRHERSHILKLRHDKDGYLTFNAKWNGIGKLLKVHREVGKAFVDNPNEYPCIDHIDGKRDNNISTNLRWCTNHQNANFELAKINRSKAITDSYKNNDALRKLRAELFKKICSRKVDVYLNGDYYGTFDSQLCAADSIGIPRGAVTSCIHGRINNYKGFTFKRNND